MAYLPSSRPRLQLAIREGNTILIESLSSPAVVRDFIKVFVDASKQGYEELIIDLSQIGDSPYFPNVMVPISAFLENAKYEQNIEAKLINVPKNIEYTNFCDPHPSGFTSQAPNVLDKVWKFESSEDVFKLVTEYMDAIYKADVFEGDNVLSWLEWCLNEVMDNVIQHAEAQAGFVMGQIHPHSKHIAFCIADAGRGIYESLRTSTEYWPKDPADALTLAVKEGVTRDKNVGQGNGLWGLHEVVRHSSGKLNLVSSGRSLLIDNGADIKSAPFLNPRRGGTIVDFQMDYSVQVSLIDILGGYQPESLKVLNSTNESGEIVKYPLIGQKSGFGTRKSGERIRNEIMNLMNVSGKKVDISFQGLVIVSSSFADEFVGKLFVELGPLFFTQQVMLSGMNETIAAIVNKAMQQRMAQEITR